MNQPTPKVNALEKLLSVFSEEQLVLFADVIARKQALAVERGCNQSVTVIFNSKGYPRHLDSTDDITFPEPKMYKPE